MCLGLIECETCYGPVALCGQALERGEVVGDAVGLFLKLRCLLERCLVETLHADYWFEHRKRTDGLPR